MHKKSGFTLIEILIVVAILAILTLTVIYSITHNLANSRDARRKADLERLKIAMEDYYGDKNVYPPDGSLGNCESEALKPYLSLVPCDPKTKLPYCYIYDNTDPKGQTYKILASFENEDDSAIASLGCEHSSVNCGYESECSAQVGYSKFDYGVSSSETKVISDDVAAGNFVADPSSVPSSTPTPSSSIGPLPSTNPGLYSCNADRKCRSFDDPTAAPYYCPLTWSNSNCNNYCDSVPSYGLCAL